MKPGREIWVPALLLILTAAGSALGQSSLKGELGTDLDLHNFSNLIIEDQRDYLIERSLSRQYLTLNFLGPLVTRDFADLSLKLKLTGVYSRVESMNGGVTEDKAEFLNPEFDYIQSQFSLFPLRTYSLGYAFARMKTYSNRYEPNRRLDSKVQSPSLGVIRLYQSDLRSHSIQGRASLAEKADISTEIKHEKNELQRQYNFEENLDIWVNFTATTEDPSPTHTVNIVNTLDDLVLIYIDLAFADSLSAGEFVNLTLEKGVHEVDFVPTRFNAYNARVDVQSFMRWQIAYIPPQGSADQDQTSDNAETILKIGGEGRFHNETRFLYNDLEEGVQRMSSTLGSLNNIANYIPRQGVNLQLLTNYASTTTDIRDVSSEENSVFLHQTQARLQKQNGPSAVVSHSFNRMRSLTMNDDLQSTSHIINGQGVIPTRFDGHTVNLRSTATFLSDNKNYVSNTYMVGMANKLDRRVYGFKLHPQHEIKYTRSSVDNPNAGTFTQSSDTENRVRLDGERSRLPILGTLQFKSEWEWRARNLEVEIETKNRYFTELGISKNISERLRLMLAVNQEKERYSLEVLDIAAFGMNPPSPRADQNRTMYRVDVQARPLGELILGANQMLIFQNDSEISRTSLSLTGRLPGLNTPIRSFLVNESRRLEGLPEQKMLQMQAQLSYHFRQISLVLTYSLIKERLVAEDYTYSQVYAKIARAFDIF